MTESQEPTRRARLTGSDFAFALLVALVLLATLAVVVPHRTSGAATPWYDLANSDARRYVALINGESVPVPWSYRTLPTGLARLLPLGAEEALRVVSYASLVVFYSAMVVSLRMLRFSRSVSVLAIVMTSGTLVHGLLYQNPVLSDPSGMAALGVSIGLAVAGLLGWLAIALSIGMFAREQVAALVPLLPIVGWHRRRSWSLMLMAVPMAAFLGPRWSELWTFADRVISGERLTGGPKAVGIDGAYFAKVALSYGSMWLVIAAGVVLLIQQGNRRLILSITGLLFVAGLLPSLVISDTPRALGFFLPAVVLLAAYVIDAAVDRYRSRSVAFAVVALSLASLIAALPTRFTVGSAEGIAELEDWYARYPLQLGLAHAVLVSVSAVLIWLVVAKRSAPRPSPQSDTYAA